MISRSEDTFVVNEAIQIRDTLDNENRSESMSRGIARKVDYDLSNDVRHLSGWPPKQRSVYLLRLADGCKSIADRLTSCF